MISNLQMITVYVSDVTRAVEFYTKKLGFVQVAEYNDEKDTHIIWVMPQATRDDPFATQIGLQRAEAGDPRIGGRSAGWSSPREQQRRSNPRIAS